MLGMTFDIDDLRVRPGDKVKLDQIDTRGTPGWDPAESKEETKEEAKAELLLLNDRLEQLQELLYAESKNRVLIVIQAMDAGGKDGTVRHVFEGVNPSGVKVAAFKRPTEAELAHDYLWRVHSHVPGNGELVIFNRSHYEDVLVVRVSEIVPKKQWQRRFHHIREFEQMLTDEGTTIIKLFLHISKQEQKERLEDRLNVPEKHWKFEAGDLGPRSQWDEYQRAFEDLLEETSTADSPWYVIPADRKWYRNVAVSEIVIQTLERLNMAFPEAQDGLDQIVIPD